MATENYNEPEWYPEETKKRRHKEKLRGAEKEIAKTQKQKVKQKEIDEKIKEQTKRALQEEKETIDLVNNPNFLYMIIDEIQNKQVVGERDTIEAILIITNCRLVENVKSTSSNGLVNDESGLGKDWIVKSTLKILPSDSVVSRTKITPELFTYWHNPKYEPEWTWDGKIFYLEDASDRIINSDVFKVFSSGGSKATVLVKQTPIEIEIKGKPSMIITSAEANPNNENLRRYPILFLDGSDEQTLNIMKRQSQEDETGKTEEYDVKIKQAIARLKKVKVVIPFAQKLPYFFPKNRYMRTHFKRFLDYIKAVACFYQYQREKTEDGTIIATGKDYDIARRVLLKTTSNPSMIPLTKQKKDILDFFKNNEGNWFSISDIEDKFAISDRWLRSQVKDLFKDNFLLSDKQTREESKKPVPVYCYNEINKIEIPTWENIINNEKFETSVNSDNSFNSNNSDNSVNTVNNSQGEHKEKKERNKRNKRNSELTTKLSQGLNKQIKKIENLMATKPKTDWAINDICFSLGIASLSSRKEITNLLERVTADPKNKTRIRKADGNGLYWRLAEAGK